MNFQDFPSGMKVVFTMNTERYPHFTVPSGTTGTVIESTPNGVWIHVNEHVPGLSDSEEWTGDFHWAPEDWALEPEAPFECVS